MSHSEPNLIETHYGSLEARQLSVPRVRQLMVGEVVVCQATDSCEEVARRMGDQRLGMLPVLSEDRLVGVVTDRDLALRGLTSGSDPRAQPVFHVMTPKVFSVEPDTSLDEAIRIMRAHRVRRLLVTHQQKLVGVLTLDDLLLEVGRGTDVGRVVQRSLESAPATAPSDSIPP